MGGAVEPLPVLGSICLRHVLPESFTYTTGQKVGVYLNAYVPAAAAIKMLRAARLSPRPDRTGS